MMMQLTSRPNIMNRFLINAGLFASTIYLAAVVAYIVLDFKGVI